MVARDGAFGSTSRAEHHTFKLLIETHRRFACARPVVLPVVLVAFGLRRVGRHVGRTAGAGIAPVAVPMQCRAHR